MRLLRSFLVAAIALIGVTAAAHAETFGAEPYAPDPFETPVDNYIGFTGHAGDGVAASTSAASVTALRLRAGPVLALGAVAICSVIFDPEAALVVATTAPAVTQKALDELKGNIKRVLDLEEQIKQGVEAGKGVAELKQEVQNLAQKNAELIDAVKAEQEKALQERLDEIEVEMKARFGGAPTQASPGTQFVESEAFKTAGDRTAVKGVVVARKDLTTAPNQNPPNYTGEVVIEPDTRLAMRDLIPVGRSERDVIAYVAMTQRAENAAVVAEGAVKPESNIALADRTAQMVVLAHHIPVTKQQLSDNDGVRSLIDAEMDYGLRKAEDSKVVADLIAAAVAYDSVTYSNGTLLDQIRGQMAQLQVADYVPDGIVLNPIDWFNIEITKTTEGAYVFVNPQTGAAPRLWGLPVVATNQMAAADTLVGAMNEGAQIFDGQLLDTYGVQIETGYVNDQFVRNQLTILAEMRMALAIKRPGAFVYNDSDA
ncbi:MAG: phage major capsid protein [Bacteroidota bacterium]